jgi:hypothetical protein
MSSKRPCTPQNCDLPVKSVTVATHTLHFQNDSAEQGDTLRNYATISLVVPGNKMSMDIHSADEPGFLEAVY